VGILVVLLVAAWGLVLGPPLLQTLSNSPLDTERMFKKSMRAMGRRTRYGALSGRNILVPAKASYPLQPMVGGTGPRLSRGLRTAAERRRRNLANLAIFVIGSFVLAWVPGLRFLLVVNLIADVLLVLYLAAAVFMVVWPRASDRDALPVLDDPAHQAAEGL
jgi:hypothetical protein